MHEGEDAKVKQKRKARKKFHMSKFCIGEGQSSCNLKKYLTKQKADLTFGQLVEMVPKLKRKWKKLVNPVEREPKVGSMRVLAINKLPNICPMVDVWQKRRSLGEGYVNVGAQICVIT